MAERKLTLRLLRDYGCGSDGARHTLDVAGGPPSGENLDVAFVNAAENGVERFDGTFAGTQGGRDGGGGTGAVAEGGPLLAFAAGEFVSQCF